MLKKLIFLTLTVIITASVFSQTTLTEAVDFHVKTIEGTPIYLFPLLDEEHQIVVVDFFSTSCGPCQDYADDFQACYENFGYNEGNVYMMGINWGNDNAGVYEFDSIFGLTYPTASGSEGGGNIVYQDYEILSYPTVIVITPDHTIVEQYVWPPDEETLTAAILAAGGIVGEKEILSNEASINIFPNPVQNICNVDINISNPAQISLALVNIMGIEIHRTEPLFLQNGNHSFKLDLSTYPKGNYFLKLMDNDQVIKVEKVLIN
jgi:thiol-disulfide isomerase/thioredoxin